MLSPAVNSSDQILNIASKAGAQIAIHEAFEFGQSLKPWVNIWVSIGIYARLDAFEPAKYFCLHYQHSLKHFLCFVLSHVVFPLCVDGVATATLAGDGLGFYFIGGLPDGDQ